MKRTILCLSLLTATINLFSQTNTFPSSGNVGIGTTSPANLLDIKGNDTDFEFGNRNIQLHTSSTSDWNRYPWIGFYNSGIRGAYIGYGTPESHLDFRLQNGTNLAITGGKVGIGTSNPNSELHVQGDMYLSGSGTYPNGWKKSFFYWKGHSLIMGTKPGTYKHNRIELKPGGASQGELVSTLQLYSASGVDVHQLQAQISSTGVSFFKGQGVAIGTSDVPSGYKLAVDGKIRAREVKVDQDTWSDYVFDPTYNLRSLEEVDTYIKTHKHLPGIPTAEEVEAEGLSLGEMNAKLLEKVEELTMYMIELNKIVEHQKQEIEKLKKNQDI